MKIPYLPLFAMLLTAVGSWAQVPQPVVPRPPGAPAPGAPAGGGTVIGPITRRSTPGMGSTRGTNTISNPSALPSPLGAPGITGPLVPSHVATNLPPEETIPPGTIDFHGVELARVLDIYASFVDRTILQPANLTAQPIFLTTRTSLTKREVIQALKAVLGMNGIALIDVGDKFVKAVPLQGVAQEGQVFDKTDPRQLPELGSYVTHVVQLRFTKPGELIPALQPFAKAAGGIVAIESSQIIVLRDFTENVKRMLEIIAEIDVAVPSEFEQKVFPIKYALAADIASALNSLSSGGGSTSVGRSGTASGSRGIGGGFGRSSGGGMGGMGGMGGGGYPGSGQGAYGTQTGTTAPAPGTSFGSRLGNLLNKVNSTGEFQVLTQTKIIADERTNSLLIYASHEDMKTIEDIISKLDVVLAQVLIEAYIVSVEIGPTSRDLGVSYLQHPQSSGRLTGVGAAGGKTFFSPGDFINGGGAGGTNTGGGSALAGGFNYLTSWGQDLDVTLTAIASDSRAKVLQRPRIQTSHAVQATIFVGQSRPYPTGSYYGGGAYGSYSSIQQLEIGVTLDVTPLINPEGLVVMDIHQTIEDYSGSVTITGVGDVPITTRKEAAAKVAVRDHDTIMLGGLIDDRKSSNNSGVPYLKDIPVLGYLFRSTHSDSDRNELIVLIRPTVLPTPDVAALNTSAERAKLPGVRQFEKELQRDESKLLKADEKQEQKSRTR